jgi:tetratricopeptide (TPR) repeat protein
MDKDGEFSSCESCGMKYDKQTVKQIVDGAKDNNENKDGKENKDAQNAQAGQGASDYDALVKNAEVFLELGEYVKAHKAFNEITDKYPDKSRGWWGLFESETQGLFTFDKADSAKVYYERALRFATPDESPKIARLYENYLEKKEAADQDRTVVLGAEKEKELLALQKAYNAERWPFLKKNGIAAVFFLIAGLMLVAVFLVTLLGEYSIWWLFLTAPFGAGGGCVVLFFGFKNGWKYLKNMKAPTAEFKKKTAALEEKYSKAVSAGSGSLNGDK